MSDYKATPRPWHRGRNRFEFIDADGNRIASVLKRFNGDKDIGEGNADLLDCAVNSFDAAKEALEAVHKWMAECWGEEVLIDGSTMDVVEINKLIETAMESMEGGAE